MTLDVPRGDGPRRPAGTGHGTGHAARPLRRSPTDACTSPASRRWCACPMDQRRADRAGGPAHRRLRLRLRGLAARRIRPRARPPPRPARRARRRLRARASTRSSPRPRCRAPSSPRRPRCARRADGVIGLLVRQGAGPRPRHRRAAPRQPRRHPPARRRRSRSSATTRPRSPRPCRAPPRRRWPTWPCRSSTPPTSRTSSTSAGTPSHLSRVSGLWAGAEDRHRRRRRRPGPSTLEPGPRSRPSSRTWTIDGQPLRAHEPHGDAAAARASVRSSATCYRRPARARPPLRRRQRARTAIVGRGPARIGIVAAGQDLARPAAGARHPRPRRRGARRRAASGC